MLRRAVLASLLSVISVPLACSSTPAATAVDPAASVPEGCDPIVPEQCGFPLPNDFWLTTDSAGKKHVTFGAHTLPSNNANGKAIDPALWATHDGFSPGEELVTFFPSASADGLGGQTDIGRSLTLDSSTVIVEADTGKLVAHWAELDLSTYRADDRALLIHPATRLRDGARYVVAVRHMVDVDGKPIAPSPAFAALRDHTASKLLDPRRAHFDDLFATLEKAGVPRKDLQVAWDFTTASQAQNVRDLLSMRDQALATVGAQGPAYTITQVDDAPNAFLSKRVVGKMTVPLYLDRPGPGATITRDASGAPKQSGTADYEFVMLIPKTIPASGKLGILQNGHGLLGSKFEGDNGYFAQICEQYGYVGIAVDWIGMASDDVPTIEDAAAVDIASFERAVDRQHQGFVNALLAMRMMKGRMQSEPLLQRNGASLLDPQLAVYRGDSQGGIFGATYMSITTDVTRGLLGEPGAPYTLLLDRSVDFSGFKALMKGSYPNGMDLRLIYALLQMSWDRTEPDGYLPYIRTNTLPNTPPHEILIHAALGDHQVSPLGAELIARTIGARNVQPANRPIWGVDDATPPFTGSAIVEYDFGLTPPVTNIPPSGPQYGKDPHDTVRALKTAMDQSDHFFRTGEIEAVCTGPCKGN